MTQGNLNRDDRIRELIYRMRVIVNRTPHLSSATRKEANRALDGLENQLGLNQVNAAETARAVELLNRAHSSLAFAMLRNRDFADRYAPGLRRLGLRGVGDRLDEVPASVMALPVPGPIGRPHRDELPPEERVDAQGNPLAPPAGIY